MDKVDKELQMEALGDRAHHDEHRSAKQSKRDAVLKKYETDLHEINVTLFKNNSDR